MQEIKNVEFVSPPPVSNMICKLRSKECVLLYKHVSKVLTVPGWTNVRSDVVTYLVMIYPSSSCLTQISPAMNH